MRCGDSSGRRSVDGHISVFFAKPGTWPMSLDGPKRTMPSLSRSRGFWTAASSLSIWGCGARRLVWALWSDRLSC